MLITVDDKNLTIAGHRFAYGAYYFDCEEYKHLRPAVVMGKILEQWKKVLIENAGEERTFFLPFELDDQWVDV